MSLGQQVLKGSFVLTTGEVVGYGCAFIRNVILARILTKEDFGIAASFALVISLLEFSDKLGVNTILVQAKSGNLVGFQATAHLLQFLSGLLCSVLILASAWPAASIFGIPDQLWAFQTLALIPLLKGLTHLDVSRLQREMQFVPLVAVEAVPQILISVAAWPLANWLQDFRAVLWLLIAKWVMTFLGSHAVSARPYRWCWDSHYFKQILSFGWPLVINGLLLFAAFQGDRLVVGASFPMAALGTYSVAATLSFIPGLMFIRVLRSVLLPMLSRAQDSAKQFTWMYAVSIQILACFAAAFGSIMILGGETLTTMVYGEKYAGTGIILGWLAAAQAFRIMRVGPTLAAISKGYTQNLMISNLFRLSGLGLAVIGVSLGIGLPAVAAAGLAGEIVALIAAVLLARRVSVSAAEALGPVCLVSSLLLLSGCLARFGSLGEGWATVLLGSLCLTGLAVVWTVMIFKESRALFWPAARRLWSRSPLSA